MMGHTLLMMDDISYGTFFFFFFLGLPYWLSNKQPLICGSVEEEEEDQGSTCNLLDIGDIHIKMRLMNDTAWIEVLVSHVFSWQYPCSSA